MSNLSSSNLFTHTALRGDSLRGGGTRAQTPGGADGVDSFSQMLRGYDKPIQAEPSPVQHALPQEAPKRATEPAPQAAQNNSRAPEGKSETQRQEAKVANKRGANADAPKPPAAGEANKPAASGKGEATDKAQAAQASVQSKTDKEDVAEESRADSLLPSDAQAGTPTAGANAPIALALLQGKAVPAEPKTDAADGEEPGVVELKPRGNGRPDQVLQTARTQGSGSKSTAEQADGKTDDFASELNIASLPPALKNSAPAHAEGAAIDSLLGANATAGTRGEAAADVASPAKISLAQPLYDSGFAPEMAARVSLLAADGVQEAQLHLNPAEMGPVAVQIIVDGQQAQISFHAAQAETRAVLEQSLPDLAAALRDSGLTLSGGGVFQQTGDQDRSGQQRASDGAAQSRGSQPGDEALPALTRAPVAPRATRGVVDLYA